MEHLEKILFIRQMRLVGCIVFDIDKFDISVYGLVDSLVAGGLSKSQE